MRAFATMNVEEGLDLAQDEVEGPGLIAAGCLDGVAVHGIARPHHGLAFALHGADQSRQVLAHLVGAEAADEREPPGLVRWIQRFDQAQELVGPASRSDFGADRMILDAAQKLDMRLVEFAGAVADPEEMT